MADAGDLRALRRDSLGDGCAKRAERPGDDDDLAFELSHHPLLSRRKRKPRRQREPAAR
jgi:hypothetical protein